MKNVLDTFPSQDMGKTLVLLIFTISLIACSPRGEQPVFVDSGLQSEKAGQLLVSQDPKDQNGFSALINRVIEDRAIDFNWVEFWTHPKMPRAYSSMGEENKKAFLNLHSLVCSSQNYNGFIRFVLSLEDPQERIEILSKYLWGDNRDCGARVKDSLFLQSLQAIMDHKGPQERRSLINNILVYEFTGKKGMRDWPKVLKPIQKEEWGRLLKVEIDSERFNRARVLMELYGDVYGEIATLQSMLLDLSQETVLSAYVKQQLGFPELTCEPSRVQELHKLYIEEQSVDKVISLLNNCVDVLLNSEVLAELVADLINKSRFDELGSLLKTVHHNDRSHQTDWHQVFKVSSEGDLKVSWNESWSRIYQHFVEKKDFATLKKLFKIQLDNVEVIAGLDLALVEIFAKLERPANELWGMSFEKFIPDNYSWSDFWQKLRQKYLTRGSSEKAAYEKSFAVLLVRAPKNCEAINTVVGQFVNTFSSYAPSMGALISTSSMCRRETIGKDQIRALVHATFRGPIRRTGESVPLYERHLRRTRESVPLYERHQDKARQATEATILYLFEEVYLKHRTGLNKQEWQDVFNEIHTRDWVSSYKQLRRDKNITGAKKLLAMYNHVYGQIPFLPQLVFDLAVDLKGWHEPHYIQSFTRSLKDYGLADYIPAHNGFWQELQAIVNGLKLDPKSMRLALANPQMYKERDLESIWRLTDVADVDAGSLTAEKSQPEVILSQRLFELANTLNCQTSLQASDQHFALSYSLGSFGSSIANNNCHSAAPILAYMNFFVESVELLNEQRDQQVVEDVANFLGNEKTGQALVQRHGIKPILDRDLGDGRAIMDFPWGETILPRIYDIRGPDVVKKIIRILSFLGGDAYSGHLTQMAFYVFKQSNRYNWSLSEKLQDCGIEEPQLQTVNWSVFWEMFNNHYNSFSLSNKTNMEKDFKFLASYDCSRTTSTELMKSLKLQNLSASESEKGKNCQGSSTGGGS